MDGPTGIRGAARARAALVLVVLSAGLFGALATAVQSVRFRVPLAVLGGAWFKVGLAATIAAVALALWVSVDRARAWRRGAPRGSWLSLRVLFGWAVVSSAAFVVAFPAFETPWFRLFACSSFALWAAFVAVEQRIEAAAPRLVRVVDVVLFDLAIVLVLVEGSLELVARARPSQLLATTDETTEEVLAQFRQAPGTIRFGFPLNRGGHYDEEFTPKKPGERLVACIGDSFSLGTVPHYWHYTTVCERLLPGMRVDNFGAVAIGPPEYALLLRDEALPLHPDMVVIALFVGNDVAFIGHRSVPSGGMLRRWLDREHTRTWMLVHRLRQIRSEQAAAGGGASAQLGDPSARASGRLIDDPAELERALPWLVDPLLEDPGFSEQGFLTCESSRAIDVCLGSKESYAPLFRELERIVELAGETPVGFLLIPDEFQVEDDLWASVVADLGANLGPELGKGDIDRDRPQRWINEWMAQRGLPCVDLLPRARAVEPMADGKRHVYILRNTHFNVRGYAVAADGLAELIRKVLG